MFFLNYIIVRLFLAIIPTIIWSFLWLLILIILFKIRNKNIPKDFFNNADYFIIAHYILIFLYMIIFYKENIKLF